jgi:hypothetical protein
MRNVLIALFFALALSACNYADAAPTAPVVTHNA